MPIEQKTSQSTITYTNPVWPGSMPDPFVLKWNNEYYAYGTGGPESNGLQFPLLRSKDFQKWELLGGILTPLKDPSKGSYWAPELAVRDGKFFLYYSAGGPAGENHQLRVAVADKPTGPFEDTGKLLLPSEPFSIDAHAFRDPKDGKWYLFFAKDFYDGRAGTGTAVVALGDDMVSTQGEVHTVVRATADWQIFERNRNWLDKVWDAWHTVEGPFVVYREGRYYCFYSGGRWESSSYGVGCAVADCVTGPYKNFDDNAASVLQSVEGKVLGPGHNSVVLNVNGGSKDFIVYHAWDWGMTARRMCIDPINWTNQGPKCDGPSFAERTVKLD